MPTLYVENVPAELYDALRARAKSRRTSIAAEAMAVLQEHVPTAAELRRRQKAYRQLLRLQRRVGIAAQPELATEALVEASRRELEMRAQAAVTPVRKPRQSRG